MNTHKLEILRHPNGAREGTCTCGQWQAMQSRFAESDAFLTEVHAEHKEDHS